MIYFPIESFDYWVLLVLLIFYSIGYVKKALATWKARKKGAKP